MYTLENKDGVCIYKDTMLDIELRLPETNCAGLVQTRQLAAIDERTAIEKAFAEPVSGKTLSDIVRDKGAKTACVLISDATRGIPTAPMARVAVDELVKGGIELENITFFVAIGVHRPATEDEMRCALGELYGKVECVNHTPFDKDNLIYLGDSSNGTPVTVNRRAYECDVHVQIGKVEPHEFAGFSGGRKSVLPGISSEETIRINHRPERILDPNAAIGKIDGNPVSDDMIEAAELFGIDFGVNCILNNEMKIAAVFTGGLVECHSTAVKYVRDYLGVGIEKPDVIVTCPGQPLDIDFYQSAKALIGLTEILDGDIVTLLTCGCAEGVNSPDMLRAFGSGKTLPEIEKWTTEHYEIQMDHVLLLAKIYRKGARVILSCPNVSDDEARTMLMEPVRDPQKALERAMGSDRQGLPEGAFLSAPPDGTSLYKIKNRRLSRLFLLLVFLFPHAEALEYSVCDLLAHGAPCKLAERGHGGLGLGEDYVGRAARAHRAASCFHGFKRARNGVKLPGIRQYLSGRRDRHGKQRAHRGLELIKPLAGD